MSAKSRWKWFALAAVLLLAGLSLLCSYTRTHKPSAVKPFTRIVAKSANVVVSARSGVGILESPTGDEIFIWNPIQAEMTPGWTILLYPYSVKLEIGEDDVSVNGVKYRGTKEKRLSILVLEDGSVKEGAGIRDWQ